MSEVQSPIEVQTPTCGRIVHFFPHPENDKLCRWNGADKVPAIVVQTWSGLRANISVFPMNPDATNVLRFSVPHISEAARSESDIPTESYWAWPERN